VRYAWVPAGMDKGGPIIYALFSQFFEGQSGSFSSFSPCFEGVD